MENNIASNESVINQTEPATPAIVETPETTEPTVVNETVDDTQGGSDVVEDVWAEDFNMDGEAPVVKPEDAPEAVEKIVEAPIDLDALYTTQMEDKDSKLDKPVLMKLNGKVVEIDNVNDMKDLMERGLSATKKFQEMAEDRKVIEFMNDNGIAMEDLNQLVYNGGSEPVVQDTEQSNNNEALASIVNKISASSYADDFRSGVAFLPDNVRKAIGETPELLNGLAGDFESGLAQKALPIVERSMAIKGLDFIDAYVQAVQSLEPAEVKPKPVNPLTAQPRGGSATSQVQPQKSVWDMDSTEFNKYM